ncbi:sigma-54 dependent transcriptional regulator [Mucilaginibacter sp. cycad4]|uniref:sigma-54 interaction domain-containing protein n=1 Tax=Mucilaginibacter sp. cycad4 TaxID=3342096 RepID=UPI002AAA9ACF|nr:sigma-54 dependent transcriptional regulator [Mucilaginibacter gossypii]WPV01687.1 sigma-54 dependent transcriptional regulator [Mucilaginibacter gossypii]
MVTEKITPNPEMQSLNLHYGLPQGTPIGPAINTDKESPARKSVFSNQYPGIIGNCTEMQKVYRLMTIVAPSNSTVLLLGETGTGKEVIARGIHQSSPRKNRPMVTVNCAALPANLIESELFGHERGSFTGASDRRIGKFELAHQGTIFLDEIGELPLELQVKLLRVIQEREFERVGGKTTIKVDVRIIAATNRDLEAEVDANRFRADLYYRLNVFPINLPPLRNRQEDIAELANFFLVRYSKITGKKINFISNKVLQQLKSYSWPGNVRQLEHLIERSILLSDDSVLRQICLPNDTNKNISDQEVFRNKTLIDVERSHIITVLKKCSGKIAGEGGAADWLGVPPTTLHAKMKKLNIVKQDYFPQKV